MPGDVDVLVVGAPDRDETYDAAERAQQRLGRPVNTTVVSEKRWRSHEEPFLANVHDRPRYLASEGAISSEDVSADLPAASAIVDAASRVVPSLPVFTG